MNVVVLAIDHNQCTGAHPDWSGTTSLSIINLQGNLFTGSFLPLPVVSSLTILRIDLGNRFTDSSLPNWATSPLLQEVSASGGNRFSGSIPPFHASASIQIFQVANNLLSGTIPSSSSLLGSRLQYFDVSSNRLTGSVPSLADCAASLVQFNISSNSLSGTLRLGVPLPSLQIFDVSSNQLSGSIPPWNTSAGLLRLKLSANTFTGSLPSMNLSNALIELNVSFNRFTDVMQLNNSLPALQIIDAACNSLSGSLPQWGASSGLAFVNMSCGNKFNGTVPALHANVYRSLRALDLSDQPVTGTLSTFLGTSFSSASLLPNVTMQNLSLGGAQLSGSLPLFLKWPLLLAINVSGNKLTGSITTSTTFPAGLVVVDLSNNALQGSVPAPTLAFTTMNVLLLGGDSHTFSAMPALSTKFPNLTRFSLSGSFSTVFPYAWFVGSLAWMNLTTVSLRKCGFTGTFPKPLASTQLTLIDFSRNQLSGTLPADLASYVPLLTTLTLGTNSFNGALPSTWSSLTNLVRLDVSSCGLSGTLPLSLSSLYRTLTAITLAGNSFVPSSTDNTLWATLTNLAQLDISNNNFSSLPSFGSSSTKLRLLNLSGNGIMSTLPASWSTSLSGLLSLNLSNSQFYGGIPVTWGGSSGLNALTDLDLSNNNIDNSTWSVSQLIAGSVFAALRTVRLQRNNFSGSLNANLTIGPNLQQIDVSSNQLTGRLPQFLLPKTSTLTSLQLQNNRFDGSLPKGWGIPGVAPSVQLLNLSSNLLTGPLPYNWGPLYSRSTFVTDLCGNQLCGPVPLVLQKYSSVGLSRCSLSLNVECYTYSDPITASATLSVEATGPTATITGSSDVTHSNTGPSPTVTRSPLISVSLRTFTAPVTASLTMSLRPTATRRTNSPSRSVGSATIDSSRSAGSVTPTFTMSTTPSASITESGTRSVTTLATPSLTSEATPSGATASPTPSLSRSLPTPTLSLTSEKTNSAMTPTVTILPEATPTLELPVTATRPSDTTSTSQTRPSNTSILSESVSLNTTRSRTMTDRTNSFIMSVTWSPSKWDCNALNKSEIYVGVGNATTAPINNNATRYVAVLSASPPVNPSVLAASNVPTTLVRNAIFTTSRPIDRHQLMDAPTVIVLN
ncbi:GP46-like surface antigen, putative, partial [Bodo saltans]